MTQSARTGGERRLSVRPSVYSGKYQLRPAVKKLYQLRPEVSASCVSVVSGGVCFMCISCVPSCLLHVYQLCPEVSASRVSVASRVVNPKHDELRPAVSKELYQFHRKIRVYKMSSNWKVLYSVLLYFTSYTIICTHTELLNDIGNTVVI